MEEEEWCVYYDEKSKRNSGTGQYRDHLKQVGVIRDINDFDKLFKKYISRGGASSKNIRIFKKGIAPEWEDPKNIDGGKWAVAIDDLEEAAASFRVLLLQLLKCTLPKHRQLCGLVFAVRGWGHLITLWNSNHRDREMISITKAQICQAINVRPMEVRYQVHNEPVPARQQGWRGMNSGKKDKWSRSDQGSKWSESKKKEDGERPEAKSLSKSSTAAEATKEQKTVVKKGGAWKKVDASHPLLALAPKEYEQSTVPTDPAPTKRKRKRSRKRRSKTGQDEGSVSSESDAVEDSLDEATASGEDLEEHDSTPHDSEAESEGHAAGVGSSGERSIDNDGSGGINITENGDAEEDDDGTDGTDSDDGEGRIEEAEDVASANDESDGDHDTELAERDDDDAEQGDDDDAPDDSERSSGERNIEGAGTMVGNASGTRWRGKSKSCEIHLDSLGESDDARVVEQSPLRLGHEKAIKASKARDKRTQKKSKKTRKAWAPSTQPPVNCGVMAAVYACGACALLSGMYLAYTLL